MINERIQKELNSQINKEFYSAYIYLSMASYTDEIGLHGVSHWLEVQSKEEIEHGMKIYSYLLKRNARPIFTSIEEPPSAFINQIDVFEQALAHEQYITGEIYRLVDIAEEEGDKATASFLKWFVDEQVEEENNIFQILESLRMAGESYAAISEINTELNRRIRSCDCCDCDNN